MDMFIALMDILSNEFSSREAVSRELGVGTRNSKPDTFLKKLDKKILLKVN
jgi:hypothetical protein